MTSFFFLLHLICEMVMTLSTTDWRNCFSSWHLMVWVMVELVRLGTCRAVRWLCEDGWDVDLSVVLGAAEN